MVSQLKTGVWWLQLGWFEPLLQNAYLVDDDGALTLVDAGLPWDAGTLKSEIERAGFTVADIDQVLITHYDLDHFGGLSRLVPELDAPVYVGAEDARLAAGEELPPWLHHKGAFHRLLRRWFSFPSELPLVRVSDGDEVGGFVAYHTPGHNPGHMAFVHEELRIAMLGDLVWGDEGTTLTPPFWLDSYDMRTLRESIRSLAERTPSFDIACMGHGEPIVSAGGTELRRLAGTFE